MMIPFNKPFVTGKELEYIQEALQNGHLSGDGPFAKKCQVWLEQVIGCKKALLTPSCTAALEMAAILADIRPGDEIIMPSYTFVSTANAFVLRGGVPVFVDICKNTLNIDEQKINAAITPKTKAILVVHYAGVSCEMDTIMQIARQHGLLVIEDAAQAIGAAYKDRPLGSIGHMAALSFHATKNIQAGEGGALLINDPRYSERAEIIREKGTNRSKFFRGEVDKYTWVDIGSSYLTNEITAACLWAQLEQFAAIQKRRQEIWWSYHRAFSGALAETVVQFPFIPDTCSGNAHIYYMIARNMETRNNILGYLREKCIGAVFHYVPLHASPAGKTYGRALGNMDMTLKAGDCLFRLPLWIEMDDKTIHKIIKETIFAVHAFGK